MKQYIRMLACLFWLSATGLGWAQTRTIKRAGIRRTGATPGFGADPDEETLECSLPGYLNPYPEGVPFCGLSDGYWGRDHGNDNGIPPDGFLRTLRGIYPGGGRFDDRSFEGSAIGGGAKGKGITPVMFLPGCIL